MKKFFLILIIGCFVSFAFIPSGFSNTNSSHDTKKVNTVEIHKINFDSAMKSKNNIIENESEKKSTEIAKRGCCSWHGGVCGCDEISGKVSCCDGTLSPSCTCSDY